jgi:hypothetical protein
MGVASLAGGADCARRRPWNDLRGPQESPDRSNPRPAPPSRASEGRRAPARNEPTDPFGSQPGRGRGPRSRGWGGAKRSHFGRRRGAKRSHFGRRAGAKRTQFGPGSHSDRSEPLPRRGMDRRCAGTWPATPGPSPFGTNRTGRWGTWGGRDGTGARFETKRTGHWRVWGNPVEGCSRRGTNRRSGVRRRKRTQSGPRRRQNEPNFGGGRGLGKRAWFLDRGCGMPAGRGAERTEDHPRANASNSQILVCKELATS